MSKKAKNKATKPAPENSEAIASANCRAEGIAQNVRADMQAAEAGMFHALRAGVGLLRIKELSEYGSWEQRMLELFPDKSARSLRRYMQVGGRFLEAKGLKAGSAWDKMSSVRTDRLLADPDGKADKKADPLERDLGEFIREFGSVRNADAGTPKAEQGRPLSRAEKLDAARQNWVRMANEAQEELNSPTLSVLPDEDLDSIASVFRTVSDALRRELARRGGK